MSEGRKTRRTARRTREAASVLSVCQGTDGVWTVREHGVNKAALSYFATKWAAMKHAVTAARSKPNCRVQVLDSGGGVEFSHSYEEAPARARAG